MPRVLRIKPAQFRNIVREVAVPIAEELIQRKLEELRQPVTRYGDLLMNSGNVNMEKDTKPGMNAARLLRALAAGGGHHDKAYSYASNTYGANSIIAKALGAGDATGGGFLVPSDMADEVIDLLRPRSVVRAMGPTTITVPHGTKEFPRLDSGASASYVGENQNIPASQPTTGQVVMTAKKLAALVPVSNERLSFGRNTSVDEIIRDDMVRKIATTEDVNLLRSEGTESTPKGLRFWAAAANITASNGTSATNIEDDFKDLLNALDTNDVPNERRRWLMNPREFNRLYILRDANGNLIFPELRAGTPRIYGHPVFASTNIPITEGAGNESEVYLVEATEVLFGEVEGMRIEVSRDASYVDTNDVTHSAFQKDQTLMRVVLHHDLAVKHPQSVAVKTSVTWGA